ncbi:MAG: LON peptidase substrate-binding domain-containing protein [Bacteroidales bacterium]|nr:LON peptidase substrate-binding domain-containing protein [Bacteroidales bacterium]
MTEILNNFPLFPISIIVLPGEIQPLHIFEPRYKQLIRDMEETKGTFGIPFIVDGKLCQYGSGVVLHKILAVSPTGEMDILVKGVNIFSIESMEEQLAGKLYGGGTVKILNEINKPPSNDLRKKFEGYQNQLSRINKMDATPSTLPLNPLILDIAGQMPLELEEKYKFIRLDCHEKREHFLMIKLNFLLMINKKLEEVGYRFYLN